MHHSKKTRLKCYAGFFLKRCASIWPFYFLNKKWGSPTYFFHNLTKSVLFLVFKKVLPWNTAYDAKEKTLHCLRIYLYAYSHKRPPTARIQPLHTHSLLIHDNDNSVTLPGALGYLPPRITLFLGVNPSVLMNTGYPNTCNNKMQCSTSRSCSSGTVYKLLCKRDVYD